MKTQEELNELKAEYEAITNKLKELTEDELLQVTGGADQGTFEDDKLKLSMYMNLFRKYLEDYMPTSVYPKRIQTVIDQLDEMYMELKSCDHAVEFIGLKDNWAIMNSFIKGAKAEEVFTNEWYLKIKAILGKYFTI